MKNAKYPAVLAVAVILSACSGNKTLDPNKISSGAIAEKAPLWVNRGSGAFTDAQNGKVFYGVGIVTGVHNLALAKSAADQRARAEIAKSLENYVAVLHQDYMSAASENNIPREAERQDISVALKGFSQYTLRGAVIINYWRDPKDDSLFSLARLDFDKVKDYMPEKLEGGIKEFAENNADAAFAKIAKMEELTNADK